MLSRIAQGRKKYGLRRFMKREMLLQMNKMFFRLDREKLFNAFHRIGLNKRAKVCVHSSLSRLGYIQGGADTVIDALMEAVGQEGCILMPCFSMAGSMESYLESGEIYDVRATPSQVGFLSEVFRKRSGVLRSLHPTHSMAAWGEDAEHFLKDHEKSVTPFGPNSPYGRLANRDDTYILMLETELLSLLHHLQERVDFPNLYLPQEKRVSIIDKEGKPGTVMTKVMRPRVPYFVAIPSPSNKRPDWAIIRDYGVMFPRRREKVVKKLGYHFDGFPRLYTRRKEFEEAGTLRATRMGRAEIGLLHIKSFLAKVEPELRDLIERFRPFYDPGKIAALNLPFP